MSKLYLGIDLGTSGIRSAVIDDAGTVISTARGGYGAAPGAEAWWDGAASCLAEQVATLRADGVEPGRIVRIGVDGTSGSVVLCDAACRPVTRPLMYNDGGFVDEAARISALAPDPHITRGQGSALARVLRLIAEDEDGAGTHLLHQADFVAAKLMGQPGQTDENNALKTGFDPETGQWPDWFASLDRVMEVLPRVRPAGAFGGVISQAAAARFGLSPDARIHLGTTDSIAAFLAAAPLEIGAAVTSLGSTLAVKMLSDRRIDAPQIGLYSHKLGDGWLVGGASNTGGRVLLDHFTAEALSTLSAQIDPSVPTDLDYYPLSRPGERFPINDPEYPPRISPRPDDDVAFLHGLLDGIARIEAQCYAEMANLGAPGLKRLFTAGGGAKNPVWTQLRERHLGVSIEVAEHSEAAIGVARLIVAS